jgi:protein CMS1
MAEMTALMPRKSRRHGGKRKRPTCDEESEEFLTTKKLTLEQSNGRLGAEGGIDETIGNMDPSLLADHVAKKIKQSFRDLSTVELEDKYLSQKIFSDTSEFQPNRKLEHLPSFLEQFSYRPESLSSSRDSPGSPHTLVIAASGLRAADVTRFEMIILRTCQMLRSPNRSLRKFQSKDCAVGKLFAKHIKLPEAIDYVKRTKWVYQAPL